MQIVLYVYTLLIECMYISLQIQSDPILLR